MCGIVSGKEKQHVSVCSLVDEHSRNNKIFMEDGHISLGLVSIQELLGFKLHLVGQGQEFKLWS